MSDDFLIDLQGEDELGAVIRAHLFIEHYVDQIIEILVPYSEHLKHLKLDYDGKLHLMIALGIKAEVKTPLSVLGGMRNKFAHKPNYEITTSEVNNLYKSLREKERILVNDGFNSLIKTSSEHAAIPNYKDLLPNEKFILLAIVIRRMIEKVLDELKDLNK